MNKQKIITLFLLTALHQCISAQYYYKDLLSNKQIIAERKLFKEQKTKLITIHSLEPDGSASSGFFCEKRINKNFSKIETFTKSNITGKSVLTTFFNEDGLHIKSVDSSDLATSYTDYKYDKNNNLISIINNSHSNDDDFATTLFEERTYSYNESGKPLSLLIVKGGKDTTRINFTLDEKGNVIDEIEAKPNGRHYYYYYNSDNNLTDIVRYNVLKSKLLPDFMFEYNENGQISQMITTEEGPNSDYFIWKYFYNDAGLRIIEKCLSKEKDLMGSFEYEYE